MDMMTLLLLFFGLVLLSILVVVHEWGHMITAKKFGVEVEEFGVGFPPRAMKLGKKAETTYTLNWLPLGGFVKLKGESDDARGAGTFGSKRFWQKAIIIAAGVVMNWLTAAVIFTVLALVGMPQLIPNQYQIQSDAQTIQSDILAGRVVENSPADRIGLSKGDKILKIADHPITSSAQLVEITKSRAGDKVMVEFEHNGQRVQREAQLQNNPNGGNFGVAPGEIKLVRSTWSAPIVGIGTTAQFTYETFRGLIGAVGNLLSGHAKEASSSVAGPVGIFFLFQELFKQGPVLVLALLGIISVSLAAMNILPIPALDGGRLFVMALFRVLKKPLSKETEEKIHGTGMMVLLLFVAFVTIIDVLRATGRF